MRHATKALRCNGFVDVPVSLQLTGHPFAKPHVPCVVASQLCFVHERASTSSCWSVKSSCKHEIYPDLAWRVNCNSNSAGSFYVLSYHTLLWKTCFKCPSREIHSPSGLAVNIGLSANYFLFTGLGYDPWTLNHIYFLYTRFPSIRSFFRLRMVVSLSM